MSLSHGRPYLAIPGPSVMPDRVLAAMHRPAPNIYEGPLIEMTRGLVADLKAVARTGGSLAIYVANGHGAWEAALANVANRGDRVLVLATGRFALGWGEVAEGLGLDVRILDFGPDSGIDLDRPRRRCARTQTTGSRRCFVYMWIPRRASATTSPGCARR